MDELIKDAASGRANCTELVDDLADLGPGCSMKSWATMAASIDKAKEVRK